MFGVTQEGNSVCAQLHGFSPYLYVAAPRGFGKSNLVVFRKTLQVGAERYAVDQEERAGGGAGCGAYQSSGSDEQYVGVTVIEPKRGYSADSISTLDFAPGIMSAHNLCYTTLLPAEPEMLKEEREIPFPPPLELEPEAPTTTSSSSVKKRGRPKNAPP